MNFMFGSPEEIREQIEKQVTQQEMHASLHRHELLRFFDELTDEQLTLARNLLASISNGGGKSLANFFCGYAAALAQARGICAACGENHDDPSALTEDAVDGD